MADLASWTEVKERPVGGLWQRKRVPLLFKEAEIIKKEGKARDGARRTSRDGISFGFLCSSETPFTSLSSSPSWIRPSDGKKNPSRLCKHHPVPLTTQFLRSPLLSAGPPLMILATTMAPVDLSLFIVAPCRIQMEITRFQIRQ